MNNSNDNKKSEAERIAIKALLNSSDSCERIIINELLNDNFNSSKKIAINELIDKNTLAVASLSNVRIIQLKPSATSVKPSNYREAVLLNINKPIR
jgi:hypothetical protein